MFKIKDPVKVALIDDDHDMLDLMDLYLKNNEQYETIKFSSPLDFLKYIEDNEVHIAVLDINLNEMFGDEVLRKINELEAGIEVIIITASNTLINFTSCYKNRANGYLLKPFREEHFTHAIGRSYDNILEWNKVFKEMMNRKHFKAG